MFTLAPGFTHFNRPSLCRILWSSGQDGTLEWDNVAEPGDLPYDCRDVQERGEGAKISIFASRTQT